MREDEDRRIEIKASPEFVEQSKRMTTLVVRATNDHWDWDGHDGSEYRWAKWRLSRVIEAYLVEHDPAYSEFKYLWQGWMPKHVALDDLDDGAPGIDETLIELGELDELDEPEPIHIDDAEEWRLDAIHADSARSELGLLHEQLKTRFCALPECSTLIVSDDPHDHPELRSLGLPVVQRGNKAEHCSDAHASLARMRARRACTKRSLFVTDSPPESPLSRGAVSAAPVYPREGARVDEIESLDARISRMEEQFRLLLERLSVTVEDVRWRLPNDPRIEAAVNQLVESTSTSAARHVHARSS